MNITEEDSDKDIETSPSCACCSDRHPNISHLFGYICEQSTVHGMKYLGSKKLHPIERGFWTVAVLGSLGFSVFLVTTVLEKYYESPVIISFQPKQTPVSQIPFPSITICNVNMLKRSVVTELYDDVLRRIIEIGAAGGRPESDEKVQHEAIIMSRLAQYCLSAESFRRKLRENIMDAAGRDDFMANISLTLNMINDTIAKLLQEDEISKFDHLQEDVRKTFGKSFHHCTDMVLRCFWAGEPFPCLEHFFPIETRHGHCCVFNMMPMFILQNISRNDAQAEEESTIIPYEIESEWESFKWKDLINKNATSPTRNRTYPRSQRAGGRPYGLSILLNPELNEYSTCTPNDAWGFKMVAHSPISAPDIPNFGSAIPPSSEVFVDIEPQVTVAEESLLTNIPVGKRGCYLQSDPQTKLQHYIFYSADNCFAECLANNTYKYCKCVRYFMPRTEGQKICGSRQQFCADDVRHKLTLNKSTCEHCRPTCTDIKYKVEISQFDLRMDPDTSSIPYNSTDGSVKEATNYSIVHMYLGADSLYAKERKTLYDTSELIANAGGLLGLTLGISIISFVEFIYFFTLRAYFQFRHKKNSSHDKTKDKAFTMSGHHRTSAVRHNNLGIRSRPSFKSRAIGKNVTTVPSVFTRTSLNQPYNHFQKY